MTRILSYSWDVNSGNMQYLQGDQTEDPMANMNEAPNILIDPTGPDNTGLDLSDTDDSVEF